MTIMLHRVLTEINGIPQSNLIWNYFTTPL